MIQWIMATVIGSVLTLGMALAPATAQHEHDEHASGHKADSHAEKGSAKAEALCPVMGEPVNLSVSVATDDGPVFFCCPNCIKKYKANPSKYMAKVVAQRTVLADRPKVQVTCPVTGEPTDPDVFVKFGGKKVNFCCKGCVGKYKKNPGMFKTALANSFTYQTECPVSGEEIDSSVSTTLPSGQKIYFCCKKCLRNFVKAPGKYTEKLESQGFELAASDLKPGK